MKRAISIFLLHIMMIIAIHPVVAMHFCGDELFSLNLLQSDDDDHSCCIAPNKISNTTSLFETASNTGIDLNQASCCHFDTVKLSTDEFGYQSNNIDITTILNLIQNNWFTINNLFSLNKPEPNTTNFEDEFPPKGLFMEDVSILTYICIYRI